MEQPSTPQDFVLHLQAAFVPPQAHQLGAFAADLPVAHAVVDDCLAHPAAPRLLGDTEIGGHLVHTQVTAAAGHHHLVALDLLGVLLRNIDILSAGPRSALEVPARPTAIPLLGDGLVEQVAHSSMGEWAVFGGAFGAVGVRHSVRVK